MPGPHRAERIEEPDVLKQIRIQPEARRGNDHGDDKEDEPEHAHDKEQTDEAEHSHAEVPDAEAEHRRPQREQHHAEEPQHEPDGDERHGPRPGLVEERVVQVVADLLLRLHLDRPLPFYALRVFGTFFFDLGDAQREQRAWEQRERFRRCLRRADFGELGIFGAGFGVLGGLQGADGALDCEPR